MTHMWSDTEGDVGDHASLVSRGTVALVCEAAAVVSHQHWTKIVQYSFSYMLKVYA